IGSVVWEWVEKRHLLTCLEAILRVYNEYGRRDNKIKARIKILLKAMGLEAFRAAWAKEWAALKDGPSNLTEEETSRARSFFTEPDYRVLDGASSEAQLEERCTADPIFGRWVRHNTQAHKVPG